MPMRKDSQDFLVANSGASEYDFDQVVTAAGNLKDLHNTTIGRFLKGNKAGRNTKSIIGMASRNTFEFPVFVSKSIPLEYATATNQLLEQLYASYVQMAISQNPIVDAGSVKHGGFLANFQTNTTKYVEYTDMVYAHDACHNEIVNEYGVFEFDMMNCSRADADVILECVDYEPLSEFDHFFQEGDGAGKRRRRNQNTNNNNNNQNNTQDNDKNKDEDSPREILPDNYDDLPLDEQNKINKEIVDNRDEYDVNINVDKDGNRVVYNPRTRKYVAIPDPVHAQRNREIYNERRSKKYGAMDNEVKYSKDVVDTDIKKKDLGAWRKREHDRQEEHKLKMMNRAGEFLKEDDMRKVNTMKPLLMKLQMRVKNGRDGSVADKPVEFVIGIHTHCRLIDPDVLPEMVKFPLKEMNAITRNVKWKNGELKFFRDIVFQIREKKQTAVDSRDPKKRWYRRLYQLAHEKGDANVSGRVSGNATTGLIPNATIMITNSDVENIKSQTKLDVLKPSLAKRLCNELFLMSFVVIDQDAESIKLFIPDLYSDWEVHSLASVEKQLAELSTAGSKTRDLFKLLK